MYELLELVLAGLSLGRRVEKVDSESLGREGKEISQPFKSDIEEKQW